MSIKKLATVALILLILTSVWVGVFSSTKLATMFPDNKLAKMQEDDHSLYSGNKDGLHPSVSNKLPENFSPDTTIDYPEETLPFTPEEILEIDDIYTFPHFDRLLSQWDEEWRENPPVYGKDETLLTLYLTNPTSSESWQVLYREDAQKVMEILSSVETLSHPEVGMKTGFMIVTNKKQYYFYIEEGDVLFQDEKVADILLPMKKRALLAVDLFQLLKGEHVAQTEFVGYLPGENGNLEKITLVTNDHETSENVLHILRKVHVEDVVFSGETEEPWVEPPQQSGHYSLTMSLATPYEAHEKLEVSGYPFAFLAKFTRQEGSMRTYKLSSTVTTRMLTEIANLPESFVETISPQAEEDVLPPANTFDFQ